MFEELNEFIIIGGMIVALTLFHVSLDQLGEWRKKRKAEKDAKKN